MSAFLLTSHKNRLLSMKILTSEQIRHIDAETVSRQSIPSLELMKRAARAFYNRFVELFPDKSTSVLIVAGMGNNGGDGLVVARLLHQSGYRVKAFVVEYGTKYSEDCAHNVRRVKAENISNGKIVAEADIPDMSGYDVIVDGIFGTGLSREPAGIAAEVIRKINASGKPVLSIDVPSGLFLDRKTSFAVQALETVTFQIPKLALFMPDNRYFVGNVSIVNIGLDESAIAEAETDMFFEEKKCIRDLLKPLSKFAHKGTEGHALLVGGSIGKSGAVCLATKAALRTGCGLVTAFVPKCSTLALQSNFSEAMVIEDHADKHISDITFDLHPDAIGIGIGMGKHEKTQLAFHRFLQKNRIPLVVDADGLNILSMHPEWMELLPPKTILTPHPKELSRLIGEWNDDFEKINKVRQFVRQYDVVVVVKGAYSLIIDVDTLHVNSSGTPALATAGSGDVLTGIITSLLAQGYKPIDAARVGVFLHGLTADITEKTIHPRRFVASHIIENIGNAYFSVEKVNGM